MLHKEIQELLSRSYASDGLIILVTTYKKAMEQGITNGSRIWRQIKED